MVGATAIGLSLLLAACQSQGSTRIVGPDGSPMAHVHCGVDQGACFRMAGELCPSGYELKPVLSGNDGNFLVRCRAAGTATLAAQCPTPAAVTASMPTSAPPAAATVAAASAAPAPAQSWPPAAEPPLMYPWPPPESTTAVRATPKTPKTPPGNVDIGY